MNAHNNYIAPAADSARRKIRIATTSLAGCFGCHTSLLDIDERILDLLEYVEFDRSPLTDIKSCNPCDIGIIEGGVCNAENVHVLREFRRSCTILVAIGACAISGGLPAQRNHFHLKECLDSVYVKGRAQNEQIPDDIELPLLLEQVHPIHEVVNVDYFIPGCPPYGNLIWSVLSQLVQGHTPITSPQVIRYD